MKKLTFFISCVFVGVVAQAQLVNNGGTITVQPGAVLFCAGNLTNTSGTITNNGRIEVQGSFSNAGTYNTTTDDDSLILSGGGNVTLSTNGLPVTYLTINKAATDNEVKLGSSIVVTAKLDYLAGTLSTDYTANPSFVLSAPAAAVFTFGAGREIIGKVRRTGWTNGTARVFNSANLQVATNGGTSPADIIVTMLPQAFGGDPAQDEREVKRRFLLEQTGGAGFTADVRFPYSDGELNTNTEANLVPWFLAASEWNAKLTPVTRNAGNNWVAATGVNAASFAQEWKLADPRYTFTVKAFLRGGFSGGAMTTAMNAVLPLSQPYNTAPFNYAGSESVAAIPSAQIVDWVLVELRKPSSGLPGDASSSTITGRKAGFLKSDGTIVDLDGTTPLGFDIAKQGASFITVRHRNHLGVMSNAVPSNTAGTFANDFTALANAYKNPAIPSQPVILLAGGTYGMWAGDANKSGNLAASDITTIKVAIAGGLSGYQLADVNLSGNLTATDVNLGKLMISQGGQSSSPARVVSDAIKPKSHIPGTITD